MKSFNLHDVAHMTNSVWQVRKLKQRKDNLPKAIYLVRARNNIAKFSDAGWAVIMDK